MHMLLHCTELQFVELFMNEINSMLIYLFGVAVFPQPLSYTLLYRSTSEDVFFKKNFGLKLHRMN